MEWTAEAPKVDGYYWWRRTAEMRPCVVLIFRGRVWHDEWKKHQPSDQLEGLWWGPIPVPPDNPKIKEGS